MLNETKDKIRHAVETVYKATNDGLHPNEECIENIEIYVPYYMSYYKKHITIVRTRKSNDLTYKLYTHVDDKPLITTFGCWPTEFVSDVFIRALEHFFDDYN